MSYLLDTHLLIWIAKSDPKLPTAVAEIIDEPANTLYFSTVAIWEIAIKRGLDRPDFRADPSALRAGLLQSGYVELPIESRHVLALTALPPHHRDPFDRLLVAQAVTEGMTLLTHDARVARYSDAIRLY